MGHNVIATDHGLTQDGTNNAAPGGGYLSINLHCTSCHDPHGQVNGGTANNELPVSVSGSYGEEPADPLLSQAGNYRLLGDAAYGLAPTPVAAIQGGSRTPKYGEADDYKVAYGQGMSEWCGACHAGYLNQSTKHPAGNGQSLEGVFGSLSANYNSYVKTGDFGGSQATAYLQFVPFERGTDVKADLLVESTNTNGPNTGEANVMCLSCHRAHASAFENATRWDTETELLVDSRPNAASLLGMGAVPNAAYYGRDIGAEFGAFQRGFCNKCHVKD
jgi:predicted CXXCH cytochrome family protein